MTYTETAAPGILGLETTLRGGPVAPTDSLLRPLGPDEIRLTPGFWNDKAELNASAILDHCESWMEKIGWTGNFDRAAEGSIAAHHAGIEFVDSEIYKLLEAMAWELGRMPTPELETRFTRLVERVASAQESDGYLHTAFGRDGQRPRYSDLEWGHELYCFGHLIQAAVATARSGLDDSLVEVARRLADHLYREFGPGGREAVCGHPEIEVALVEFSRATGDDRYLELAHIFVTRRGHGLLGQIQHGPEYFQDDVPVVDATVLRGHAVRALYLAAGAYDVASELHDQKLADAVALQWSNTVARRTYITGGMGSHHQDEGFGDDYELPSDRAYSETCAGIASVMLSWRLLLDSGAAKFGDLIERTLLNNVLASPRADGKAFYYANTLHQRHLGGVPSETEATDRAEAGLRAPWFWVSCCPTNVARTLASAALYFATASSTGVQLHQYGSYDVDTELDNGTRVRLSVTSGYPLEGGIRVTVLTPGRFDLTLRVPAWARGALLDGNEVGVGLVTVSREFESGDVIFLELPLEPRFVAAHPRVDAVRGQIAVERGPLVLCAESIDLPGGADTEHISVDTTTPPRLTDRGAAVSVSILDPHDDGREWAYGEAPDPRVAHRTELELLPYSGWANRGPSTMRIWMPTLN